jgi:hypothetical protein
MKRYYGLTFMRERTDMDGHLPSGLGDLAVPVDILLRGRLGIRVPQRYAHNVIQTANQAIANYALNDIDNQYWYLDVCKYFYRYC